MDYLPIVGALLEIPQTNWECVSHPSSFGLQNFSENPCTSFQYLLLAAYLNAAAVTPVVSCYTGYGPTPQVPTEQLKTSPTQQQNTQTKTEQLQTRTKPTWHIQSRTKQHCSQHPVKKCILLCRTSICIFMFPCLHNWIHHGSPHFLLFHAPLCFRPALHFPSMEDHSPGKRNLVAERLVVVHPSKRHQHWSCLVPTTQQWKCNDVTKREIVTAYNQGVFGWYAHAHSPCNPTVGNTLSCRVEIPKEKRKFFGRSPVPPDYQLCRLCLLQRLIHVIYVCWL